MWVHAQNAFTPVKVRSKLDDTVASRHAQRLTRPWVRTVMKQRLLSTIVALVLLASCDDEKEKPMRPEGPPPDYAYDLVEAFPQQSFAGPVDLQNAADRTNRLFVVEQAGRIMVFDTDTPDSTATVFLDISSVVTSGGELGLLGLAFHPEYAVNGFFFVYYTATAGSRVSRIARYRRSAVDPDIADEISGVILIEMGQRRDNHNGGALAFGPDGKLYAAIGDEGGSGDFFDNAQNLTTLHGSILRIDVDQNMFRVPYHGIPPDNPFAGNAMGYREEIYAYGLRNPWRMSWDFPTMRLWVGDVGQNLWEEVDIVTSGGNYGWDCREGANDFSGNSSAACATATNLIDPVYEYAHTPERSITGGYVYRGPTVLSLVGKYVFADYVTGRMWALSYDGATATAEDLLDAPFLISSFGRGEDGEVYALRYSSSGATRIYRISQKEVDETP